MGVCWHRNITKRLPVGLFVLFAWCCAFEPGKEAAIQCLHVLVGAAAWSSSGYLVELFVGICQCLWVFAGVHLHRNNTKRFLQGLIVFFHAVMPLNLVLKQQLSTRMSQWELQLEQQWLLGGAVCGHSSTFVDVHGCLTGHE